MIDHNQIARYPEDRPERALLRWCQAIACRDYRQAVSLSSLPAQRSPMRELLPDDFDDNQRMILARIWSGRMIRRLEIHGMRIPDSLGISAEATITLHVVEGRIGGRRIEHPPERIRLWLHRERDKHGLPDPQGQWLVDYLSMEPATPAVAGGLGV